MSAPRTGWIDENNPGDLLIPFSVALEERLQAMTAEEQAAELEKLGTTRAISKITTAGYNGLNVRRSGLCVLFGTHKSVSETADTLFHLRTCASTCYLSSGCADVERSRTGGDESMDDPRWDKSAASCWCHPVRVHLSA